MIGNTSNWIFYFLLGGVTVFLSWATTGCRVGDYVQAANNPQPTPAPSDPYTGYYVTTPKTYKLSATTDVYAEKSGDPHSIPQEIGQFITNPLLLFLADAKTGLVGLTAPTNTHALVAYIKPDFSLINHTLTSPSTYWVDPACQSTIEVKIEGSVTQAPNIPATSGSNLAISGTLQMNIQVSTQLTGNCTASLQSIAQCYTNPTLCGGQTSKENLQHQVNVQDLLDPWIQSQTINISDVSKLQNYTYEISYQ